MLKLIILLTFLNISIAQQLLNNCVSKKTCGECILDSKCAWHIHVDDEHHCKLGTDDIQSNSNIINPTTTGVVTNISDFEHLSISNVDLKIRPGKPYSLEFVYQHKKNLPIDIYFLLDMSKSMEAYHSEISTVAKKMVDGIKQKASDVFIGFGSFVDKPILPYTNVPPNINSLTVLEEVSRTELKCVWTQEKRRALQKYDSKPLLEHTCYIKKRKVQMTISNEIQNNIKNILASYPSTSAYQSHRANSYTKSYSFRNHLKLTSQVDEFSNKVNSTPTAGNIDGPEGSLEALLQAIVCTKEIGWRPGSRHWIVLSTDDAFHIAGDGKLAGIVEPNDGECHFKDDQYTHALMQDYPSVGIIKDRIIRESKNILFLITPAQEKLYSNLLKHLSNSYLGTWNNNIDITKILIKFYENTTSTVSFDHNFPSEFFSISQKIKKCETCFNNLTFETFKVSVKIDLKNCPKDGNYKQIFFIKPTGLSEQINIHTEMICDCPCEHYGKDFIPNAEECNNNGNMTCGVCRCSGGKIGRHCECDTSSALDSVDDKKCKNPSTNEICSSNGYCKCGQCYCSPGFNGTYCDCNSNKCSTPKGDCSGNGVCNCDKCECQENWSGPKCECSKLKDTCMMESMECSNRGSCVCGKCVCKDKYRGDFCEDCDGCPNTCNDFEPCVKCFYKKENCENCHKFNVTYRDNFTYTCAYKDENCLIKFSFMYEVETETAEILTRKDCPPLAAGLNYMLYTSLLFLFLGLLILFVWITVIQVQNRREYKKFLIDKQNTKWGTEQNPLFKDPVTNFNNPLFGKKED